MFVKTILTIALLIGTNVCLASNAEGVKITRIHIYEKPLPAGGVFVTFSGAARVGDTCPGSDQQYFIDLNVQPRGALLYAHAMTAMTAMTKDLNVNLRGTGKCAGHALVETIKALQVYK